MSGNGILFALLALITAAALPAGAFAQTDTAPHEPSAAAPEVEVPAVPAADAVQPGATAPPWDIAIRDRIRTIIDTELTRLVLLRADRAMVEEFYRGRGFAPIWFAERTVLPRARSAVDILRGAGAHGLDPDDYPTPFLSDTSAYRAAVDELVLTNSMLRYIRHLAAGRVDHDRVSNAIHYDPQYPGPAATLAAVTEAADFDRAIEAIAPRHRQYRALMVARPSAGDATVEGGVVRIAGGPILRPGDEDARVPALRRRLNLAARSNAIYDDELIEAVRRFQAQNRLQQDGLVGPQTLRVLNADTAATTRNDIVETNLERWRWLPADFGRAYVIVNVADYSLAVVKDGATIFTTSVVVGAPGRRATPLFNAAVTSITVNATTGAMPPEIAGDELVSALKENSASLDRVGLRLTRDGDGSVRIVQPPGSGNALSRLRFNMPNRFMVSLHDTPDPTLFEQGGHAQGHASIRVRYPEQFAEALLAVSQPEEGYTRDTIAALYGGDERTILLKQSVPIYVTYQTAFVDPQGQLQISPDIYGHDAATAALLREAPQSKETSEQDDDDAGRPVMAQELDSQDIRPPSDDPRGFDIRPLPPSARAPYQVPDRHSTHY